MLRVAAAHRIAVFAVVSNYGTGGFSPAIAKAILAPGRAQDRAASGMVAAAAGTAGLNLDFEAVLHKERPLYTAFATRAAGVLHGASLKQMLSVPAVQRGFKP